MNANDFGREISKKSSGPTASRALTAWRVVRADGAVAGADVVRGKESGYAADLKAPERFVAWLLAGHRSTA